MEYDDGVCKSCDDLSRKLEEAERRLAAARSEQHAECVRLLRQHMSEGYVLWADVASWLESHKPSSS